MASVIFTPPREGVAAQKQFFVFQSPGAESVPGNYATNYTVTLTYSNASGTLNNAVFANSVSVVPSGQGVTASLAANSPAIPDNGGTGTLPLTISATTADTAGSTYQIIVTAANNSFTANVPSGIYAITNFFTVSPPPFSNAFSMTLSPATASFQTGVASNLNSTLTLVDQSSTISGVITNGVTVSGPDLTDVTAQLNSPFAALTNNFGQTNLTLTLNVNSGAAVGTYTVTVNGTNNAFTANPVPGVNSAIFTLTLFTPRQFTMGITPASETVAGGMATNVMVGLTLTNVSGNLTEALTNSVTITGPDSVNVTAGLNSPLATPTAGGGTASLTLFVTNNGAALPGTYTIVVTATNSDFSANSPVPGSASLTNIFIINPLPPPSIQNFIVSGTTLEITGSSGLPGKLYAVLSSTNLSLPFSQWTPVLTNLTDAEGNFDASFGITNTMSANSSQQYFVVNAGIQATNQLPVMTAPSFSPAAGPFYAETPVTITTTASGATIRYTTDGSTPTETHGTIYTGPVTMQQAIYTDMSQAFVTNASGVTMLKAVAYKSGQADSAVFTGNYIIIIPLRYPMISSPVSGLAHMAYNVSGSNWNSVLNLWTNYLGFDTVTNSSNFALVKINDQQFIELYQNPVVASQYQLANYGFYVSNAEAFREQLSAAGISVPPGVTTNALGNLSFFTVDPDGHTNEWLQYLTNSVTGQSLGQHMPGTQLFGYMDDYGDATADVTAADNYYSLCGLSGTGTKVYLPNNNCYIEMLTYSTLTQTQAGKHEKAQLVTFRGMDVLAAAAILQTRDATITQVISTEGGGGFPTHNCVDVYNADLSRIRMIDINY